MKTRYRLYAIALTVLLAACVSDKTDMPQTGSPGATITNTAKGAEQGELLIKFRPEISALLDKAQQTRSQGDGKLLRSGITTVDQLMDVIGGYELERIFPLDARHEGRTRKTGLHLWYVVRFDNNLDVQEVATKLSQLGELSKIEYSREIKRSYTGKSTPFKADDYRKAASRSLRAAAPFNDPELKYQWHYINDGDETLMANMSAGADINCAEAWEICTGDPSIIVAVMDEGVMWSHEDLADNIWINEAEVYKSDQDNDGNGYKGDVYGYNFVFDTGIITWDHLEDTGHGTHVAGTVAAVNNNNMGVSGVAGGSGNKDGVKIMSLQIFSGDRGVTTANEVRAIKYAADNGAVILQCSWGYISALADPTVWGQGAYYDDEEYEKNSPLEKEAFDYFIYNAGSPNGVMDGGLVVFAAGNEEASMGAYPAAYRDYLCVSAINADFAPALYSNYGFGVDIAAPGGDADWHQSERGGILSTLPPQHGDYGYMSGTSMACPHVSGMAALGLSYAAKLHKHFDSRQFRNLMIRSVQDLDVHLKGKKLYYPDWMTVGNIHPSLLDLSTYRGKMGSGVANAALLLRNIENAGIPIRLPNAYVAVGGAQKLDVMRCFNGGETGSFTVTSANGSIAEAEVSGHIVTIKGKAAGSTNFTVKNTSTGETQTAYITVRKEVSGNGWL